jgi:hypothetical protein
MGKPLQISDEQIAFLARFAPRGWMAYPRDDTDEQVAVDLALRKRWLPGAASMTPRTAGLSAS